MAPLQNSFNNDFIDNKIKNGSIISIDFDSINHPKWNIILDISRDNCLVASVFINSKINFNFINSEELKKLQYHIDTEKFCIAKHFSIIFVLQIWQFFLNSHSLR